MTSVGADLRRGLVQQPVRHGRSSQRRNLNRVIAAINGTPGYVVPNYGTTGAPYKGAGFDSRGCPTNPALFPSRIRISVYSVADKAASPTPWSGRTAVASACRS